MASWDPMSYVSEALSRRITAAAKQAHVPETPSYYDSLANHFQTHSDSERIKSALFEYMERNKNISIDISDISVFVVFNPRDMRSAESLGEEIKSICYDAIKAQNALSAEIKQLQMSGEEVTISSELYDILNTLQVMNQLTENKLAPMVSCQSASNPDENLDSSFLSKIQLLDNFRVRWPRGLCLCIDDFFEAWFVDNCIFQMTQRQDLLGAMMTMKGFSSAFGVPRGSEVWKSGITVQTNDGTTKFIGSIDLYSERPAVATSFSKSYVENPLGMICGTASCRSVSEAHCLSTALVSFDSCKAALHAIKKWREAQKNKSSMSLLGFQLFLRSGKNISDEDDNEVGENDTMRLREFDNDHVMNEMHQTIEKHAKFGDFALKDVIRNNSADAFHLLLSHRDINLERRIQNCFSLLEEACAVISYFGHGNVLGVSVVYGVQFSQCDGLECTLTVSRSSPSYNYVFAEGSQFTLNLILQDGENDYESILGSYPSWINKADNGPVFFEHEGKRYVTTAVLKKKSLQSIFTTVQSSLMGDRLFLIGRLSHISSVSTLMKSLKTYYPSQFPPYQYIHPVFFTTVHKLYGTVGLVGWGCHVCSLQPPMISLHCSADSSNIVMEDEDAGLKSVITFLTVDGSSLFANKTNEEIKSFLPIPASAVSSLPSTSVAFRLKCKVIQKMHRILIREVICFMSILEAELVSEGSMSLRLLTGSDIVVPF